MIKKRMRHIGRYKEVVTVLVQNGFGFLVETGLSDKLPFSKSFHLKSEKGDLKSVGRRIRRVIEELGPTFIKIGQIASTRPDIIPGEIIHQLEKLQDDVSSFAFHQVREIIEEELGFQMEDVFAVFDEQPLAAASIGQVHRGVLISGETVAVKVQRPNISAVIETDLEILMDIASLAQQQFDWAKMYQVKEIISEFAETLRSELDYMIEGRNAEKIARQFLDNPKIKVPAIYWEYSGKKVLTMEYLQGTRPGQMERLVELGFDPVAVAKEIVKAMFHQILMEGFFHGDPHPGNLLVLPGQVIAFLDFGMVGRLTPQMKYHFASLVIGIIRKDTDEMIEAILHMGIITGEINMPRLRRDVEILKDKYLEVPLSEISLGEAINELFSVAFKHRIVIPSDLTLLGKSLLTLEGTVEKLAPDLSLIDTARPFGDKLLRDRFRISTRARTVFENTGEYVELLLDLPKQLGEMAQKLIKGTGRVEIGISEFNLFLKKLDRINNQLSFSIVLLSFNILMASLIIASSLGERRFIGDFSAVDLGFILAVFMFGWLLWAIFRSGRF